ncbi:MAG: hypothetical protein GWP19_06180 [Planctomycetia bacterium]|nr:hypothetical protein [Planctomycetia bacterium]
MSNQISNKPAGSKSVGASLILTFLFGPLGMFYSTVPGAIVMLILYTIVGIVTALMGIIFLHPITMIWGAVAVSNHNKKLATGL